MKGLYQFQSSPCSHFLASFSEEAFIFLVYDFDPLIENRLYRCTVFQNPTSLSTTNLVLFYVTIMQVDYHGFAISFQFRYFDVSAWFFPSELVSFLQVFYGSYKVYNILPSLWKITLAFQWEFN